MDGTQEDAGVHAPGVSPTMRNAPLLLERYRPVSLIARGGTASVFRGHDELLGRDIAIKVFSGANAPLVEQYRDELRILASLSHHGVVTIVDAGVDQSTLDDPRPFLVMELVVGDTIRTALNTRLLSTQEIGEIGYEVAEALEYVHSRGVIHRDITPSNIMLVDYGTEHSRQRARLTDFGIALAADADGVRPETITGTAQYMSPEQVSRLPLTTATDIYSLGLILLEAFTGTMAFPGAPVESAMMRMRSDPAVPDTLEEPWRSLMVAMTARDPASRPSAAAVATELRRALRGHQPRHRG